MREQIISAFSNRHLCCLLAYSLRTPFMSHVLRFPVMLTLLLAGCHSPSPPPCHQPDLFPYVLGEVMMQTTLWFGLSKPQGGSVSSLDWMNFIDKQVTPRFKAGLSVYDAQGQWLGENGQLAREKAKRWCSSITLTAITTAVSKHYASSIKNSLVRNRSCVSIRLPA